ncbi:MAG TPA: 50S ribosomal protein L2, partial [bacterium]|nr:50S ribosomal protein L2 [bacterium]
RRHATYDDFSDLTKKKSPEKSLIVIKKKKSGRNNQGKITVRHRGGGTRKYLRLIDFFRNKFDVPATVASIEYDPNRGA